MAQVAQTRVAELILGVRAELWASRYNHSLLTRDSLSTAVLKEDLALVTKQAISYIFAGAAAKSHLIPQCLSICEIFFSNDFLPQS